MIQHDIGEQRGFKFADESSAAIQVVFLYHMLQKNIKKANCQKWNASASKVIVLATIYLR